MIDVGVYSKKIIVKKLVLVTVPDFQQSHLQMAWEFVSYGMYQLGICGCRAVICHSDVEEIKNDIIAGGTK